MEKVEEKKMKKMKTLEVQTELLKLMNILHRFLVDNDISYYLIAGSTLGAVRHNGFIPWDDDIDIGIMREDYEKFLKVAHKFDSEYDVVDFHNCNKCDFFLCRIYLRNTMIDMPSTKNTKLDKRLYLDIFPIDNVPENEKECAEFEKKVNFRKKILQYCDVRDFKKGAVQLAAKKIISYVLSAFRGCILESGDKLMKKYRIQKTDYVCSLCSQYSFKKQKMPREYYGVPKLHKFCDSEFYVPEKTDEYLTTLYGKDYMQVPPESKRRKGYDIYKTDGE